MGRPVATTKAKRPQRKALASPLNGERDILGLWAADGGEGCIVHLVRNTVRYAARQYWDEMSRDLRPVYTAPSQAAANERFVEFSSKWGKQYRQSSGYGKRLERVRAIPKLRRRNQAGHMRTHAVESLNARYRRAVRARGLFPQSRRC